MTAIDKVIADLTEKNRALQERVNSMELHFKWSATEIDQLNEGIHKTSLKYCELITERDTLKSALNAMLTHMGMDEDEWNKPTFDQARKALAPGAAQKENT